MGQATEMRKLIDASWHAIYKTQKLIAMKLNSFTVYNTNLQKLPIQHGEASVMITNMPITNPISHHSTLLYTGQ